MSIRLPEINPERFQAVFLFCLLCVLLQAATPVRADEATAPGVKNLTRYLTAKNTDARLTEVALPVPDPDDRRADDLPGICIDPRVHFQQIEGFGGAFTDAAVSVIQKMPQDKQEAILRDYFDPVKGIGYTLCRTHLTSCDFSTGNYTYCDTPGDLEMKTFSVERDRKSLIAIIKRALAISHNGFKLYASPWSPPAWMKTNGEMEHGGKLKPECRGAWALYFARYIQEFAKEQIPIWGVTVQNEPAASQSWESCLYTGPEERDFVRDYLGPTLAKEGLGGVKIIIWDHNRDILYERAKTVYDDPQAARYVWGAGFHWYAGDNFDNVQRTHDAWPGKPLLLTEACQENGPHVGDWGVGERYGHSIIEDLNHWSVGWVDWNLVLDQQGGPNHVNNFCSAPILANPQTGEYQHLNSYYYLGQFSKFIHPGATRIMAAPTDDHLEATAFSNPDGQIVVVVMNRTVQPIKFHLRLGDEVALVDAPEDSIQTLVMSAP